MSKTSHRSSQKLYRVGCACLMLVVCGTLVRVCGAAAAAPVLLSEASSTRAVALESVVFRGEPFALDATVAFSPDRRTRIMLFASNVELYAGEGANAFLADAEDAQHRHYPLTVEYAGRVPQFEGITALVVRLSDELGDVGDVLLRVSLHGMASNRVRIGIGHTGGGLPDDSGAVPTPAPATPPTPRPLLTPDAYTGAATSADTVRLLEQASFGPTPSEVARVQGMGFRAYLNEQFNAPASGFPSLPLMPSDENQGCAGVYTCLRDNYSTYPLQIRFFRNALYGQDQLRQRVAFALHQIFVVSGRIINQPSGLAPYVQTLERNAFGNFRQLLYEITLNPAMGKYLDMAGNHKENPNENYAREVLQLFSVGPDLLNADGTPRLDEQGRRIPTYHQATITNFARVFTGWNIPAVAGEQGVLDYVNPMTVSRESNHDAGAKTLLGGVTLPAGQTSAQDLNAALDNIFNHPNVAPFIGKRLIRHLVTSNPSPAYVARVAAVFDNNCAGFYPEDSCTGARGDLKAVVRAVLLDPEARGDVKTDPNYGRLREPALYIANICRAFDAQGYATGLGGSVESDGYLNPESAQMGQDVFKPATVFGYFPAEYTVPGTSLTGPEYGLLSTSSSLKRDNFAMIMVAYSGVQRSVDAPNGTHIGRGRVRLKTFATDPARLVAELDSLLMHGSMPSTMRASVTQAVAAIPSSAVNYQDRRVEMAIYLVLSAPQYQLQR